MRLDASLQSQIRYLGPRFRWTTMILVAVMRMPMPRLDLVTVMPVMAAGSSLLRKIQHFGGRGDSGLRKTLDS